MRENRAPTVNNQLALQSCTVPTSYGAHCKGKRFKTASTNILSGLTTYM